MTTELHGVAWSPEPHPRRHPTWLVVLFGALFLVNLAPVALLGLMGGFTRAAWEDPTYPPALAVVVAATLLATAGMVGVRRGWHVAVLSLLGLVMVAWPLFVAWVLLNMLVAAL